MLDAIRRIVTAECQASRCPQDPQFDRYESFPLTDNDDATTARVADAFTAYFGDRAGPLPRQSASEDFSDIPTALGVPYTYWGIGGIDPDTYRAAEQAGRTNQDIPVNHSALTGIRSARCNRRISAPSSTDKTTFPARLGSSQGLEGVGFDRRLVDIGSVSGVAGSSLCVWSAAWPGVVRSPSLPSACGIDDRRVDRG